MSCLDVVVEVIALSCLRSGMRGGYMKEASGRVWKEVELGAGGFVAIDIVVWCKVEIGGP